MNGKEGSSVFRLVEAPAGNNPYELLNAAGTPYEGHITPSQGIKYFKLPDRDRILDMQLMIAKQKYELLAIDSITALSALRPPSPKKKVYEALGKTCKALSFKGTQSADNVDRVTVLNKVEEILFGEDLRKATGSIMASVIDHYKSELTPPQIFAVEEIQELEVSPESTQVIIKKLEGFLEKKTSFQLEDLTESVSGLAGVEWVIRHYDEIVMNAEIGLDPKELHNLITSGFWDLVKPDEDGKRTRYSFADSVDSAIQAKLFDLETTAYLRNHPSEKLRRDIDRYDISKKYSPSRIFAESKEQREMKKNILETFKDCLELLLIQDLDEPIREKVRGALHEAFGRSEFLDILTHTFRHKKEALTSDELDNTLTLLDQGGEFEGMDKNKIRTHFIKILKSEDVYNTSKHRSVRYMDFATFIMEILEDRRVLGVIYRTVRNKVH